MRVLLLIFVFSGWLVTPSATVIGQDHRLVLSIRDTDSGQPIPARIYLTSSEGTPYFFESLSDDGDAFRYEKKNWINPDSIEYHTTVSAHGCAVKVPAGDYRLVVERGKEYHPHHQTITVDQSEVSVDVALKRWVDMAARGWFSGDLHLHRELAEIPNVILAEDLNVVFPLTNWVTHSDTPPSVGDKNVSTPIPSDLIRVDPTHVIWPLSTEYEIFSVGEQRHTLGALFVLGHSRPLRQTVPPWKPVVEAARASDPGVLFDMDKLAWPFAMTLPVIANDATYELANNHMWRTEFAFREWYTPAPSWISPPFGATEGGESEWIDFTLGMYYALLNSGFHMPPSAGTANGVHPVPAGFGRVYVHLPGGFDFEAWTKALQGGRSFVTTGPMLMVTADGKQPGESFEYDSNSDRSIPLHIEVISEQPLSFAEVVINGVPRHLVRGRSERTESGAYRTVVDLAIEPSESGWFAVRCFEDREGGRVRVAHTAPWYVSVDGKPTRPTWAQREYLINRMQNEIQRSRGVVSPEALAEYEEALQFYRSLDVHDDTDDVKRQSRPLTGEDRERWLRNMIVDHRFTADEVRMATGLSIDQATREINRMMTRRTADVEEPSLRILPYPGGRHPRRGFLDGAIDPQRETKVSVFPPWENGGYAVVDVPEAIFSNLGLTYLAHTHVPTIWTERELELEPLEWNVTDEGLRLERRLPNGIVFGSRVSSDSESVSMEMWLTNGTDQPLSAMRSQVCVMLKGLVGFNSQRRRPHIVDGSFVAIKADRSDRWLITSWVPNHRAWTNPPVPCIHSDPIFPDCPPGETVQVQGKLWFYEGEEIHEELKRLKEK
jgi:hypothetical protein